VIDLIESIEEVKADCMGLICPTCFDEFDLGQIVLNRKYHKNFELPVIYYFQLLGLAQGLEPKELGLHFHKIKTGRVTEKVAAA
jgi:heterodisulfide reductase subunit B